MVAPADTEALVPTRTLPELDDWLAGFGIPAMAPRHAPRAEWSPEEAEAIELLATDPGRFLASLRAAVAAGPGVDRACSGALQADLAEVKLR